MHARQSRSPTFNREWIETVLAAEIVTAVAELIDTPMVKLIKLDGVVITPDTLLATLTAAKANFTDYTDKALTLTGPRAIGGVGRANGGVVNWLMTTDPVVTGNRIYGYYVEDANGWVMAEIFDPDDEIDMNEVGASLILEVLIPLAYTITMG